MSDLVDLFESTRKEVSSLLSSLSDEQLESAAPATPGWTIKDVAAHLVGDVEATITGGFPIGFFANFGRPEAVAELNEWTASHVSKRSHLGIHEILREWDERTPALLAIFRGTVDAPEGMPPFGAAVLTTDLAVHQQDIFGALGMTSGREDGPVKVGVASYIGGLQIRMGSAPVLAIEAPGKRWTTGSGEPVTTVRAPSRFELFRALSGRRSPDQIKAWEWSGDPEPFLELFYPYGVRTEALVE